MNGGTAVLVHSGRSNYGSGFNINLYVYHKQVYQDIANNYTRVGLGMYVQTPGSGYTIAWSDFGGSYIGVSGVGSNGFSAGVSYQGGTIWLVTNQEFNVYHSKMSNINNKNNITNKKFSKNLNFFESITVFLG